MGEESCPVFLKTSQVEEIHAEQISLHGGIQGLGSPQLLESALASPQHLYVYDEDSDIFDLAAAYCSKIGKNQPFIDGNKRTGLNSAYAFLEANGVPAFKNIFSVEEYIAKQVELRNTDHLEDKHLAMMFFTQCTPQFVFPSVIQIAEDFKSSKKPDFSSKEEIEAYCSDFFLTHFSTRLMDYCQKHWINPVRFHGLEKELQANFIDKVHPHFRQQFGMVIKDDSESE